MKIFDVDDLLQTARERTGLANLGPEDFREGLNVLVDSLNAQRKTPERVWHQVRERLLRLLMNRAWFAQDLAGHPDIMDEDPGSPIIIASLPRTGSTKLHRMLGASGNFQTLTLWKANMFARIPGLPDGGRARRIAETREFEQWMYATSPEILQGHPMYTDEPDEDHLLTEYTFRSSYCGGLYHVPEYSQWLMQADMKPVNDYYLAQIKYLQWQAQLHTPMPWLLKTPDHIGNERNLSTIYKDPRFIVLHRDPVKCIPSVVNTIKHMSALYNDFDNTAAISDGFSRYYAWKAAQQVAWRADNPNAKVLDLRFSEINQDGMATVRKVYDFFGMPLSLTAENAMRDWEQRNRRDRYSPSVYSAAMMGSTDDAIREMYAPYIERYAEFL